VVIGTGGTPPLPPLPPLQPTSGGATYRDILLFTCVIPAF